MTEITGVWIDECERLFPQSCAFRDQVDPVDILEAFLAAQKMYRLRAHVVHGRRQWHDEFVIPPRALAGDMHQVVDYNWTLPRYAAWKTRYALHMSLLDTIAHSSLALGLYRPSTP